MSTHQTSRGGALDRIGIIASTACFIRCLLRPVVLSLSTVYAHFLPTEEYKNGVLAAAVTLIGTLAIGSEFGRHKESSILWLMVIGVTLIA
jgi:hypothetical protein